MDIRLRSFRAKRASTPVGTVPELFHTSLLLLVSVDFRAEIVARTMQVTTVLNSARAKKDLSKRRRCVALMFNMMRTSTTKNYDALSFHSFKSIVRSNRWSRRVGLGIGDHSCEAVAQCFACLQTAFCEAAISEMACRRFFARLALRTQRRIRNCC